jgi:hypothetical protein
MGGIVTPIALRGLKVDRQHELGEAVEITLAHDVAGGLNVAHETFSMNAISKLLPERSPNWLPRPGGVRTQR